MQTSALTFFIAFVVVLGLIGLAAWLVRRFAGNRLGANANRGRMPRLAVIDAAAVDGRRRLVLVRRDNVEHLLMIGGPTDIVVEPNIVRALPGRDQAGSRAPAGSELPRVAPLPDAANWTGGDAGEPAEPAPRARPSFLEENRRSPMPPLPERRSESPPGFMPEPMSRQEPRAEPRSEPRADRPDAPPRPAGRSEAAMPRPSRPAEPPRTPPRPAPTPPPAPAVPGNAEQNLAEMAQRLEAALRRPGGAEPHVGAPPAAPSRNESPATPPAPKSGFENLEDEMASLLGRPKTPS